MSAVGLAVLVGTLLLACGLGVALRLRSGQVRAAPERTEYSAASRSTDGWRLAGATAGPTGRVLLLQLSSPVCTPCRQAAAVLGELSAGTSGLRHVEIDIADRPEVARELGVLRTPTVIAFDRTGTELLRVSGVPNVTPLLDALAPSLR